MHVTAIIPAKGESRRLPGKNLRPFGGSTLIAHKVRQLRECRLVDDVVVGSDDDAILAEATGAGASVRRRDAYHCDERRCSANEMIRNLAAMVETDVVLWAHCTNPLVGPEIYDRAIQAFDDVTPVYERVHYDSLCSVTRAQRHAWFRNWGLNFSHAHAIDRHPLANELEPVFLQDGAIFIQQHSAMLRYGYFYGQLPYRFEVEWPFGLDIDTERDLVCAEALQRAMAEGVPA